MTTTNKLVSAALIGLMSAGLLAAQPAFAGEHEKGACNGKSGCKGKDAAEKSECKGKSGCSGKDEKSGCEGKDKEANSCKGKDGEKASCSGKSGCAGKEEKK